MPQSILVVAEQRGGALRKNALEAASVGRELAAQMGAELCAVVVGGPGVADLAASLGAYGVPRAIAFQHADLALPAPAAVAHLVADAAKETDARVVLGSSSATGRDLLPRVAALLGAGCVSDATGVAVANGRLEVTRPVYAGKALATVAVSTPVAVVGLRQVALQRLLHELRKAFLPARRFPTWMQTFFARRNWRAHSTRNHSS